MKDYKESGDFRRPTLIILKQDSPMGWHFGKKNSRSC